MFCVRYCCCSSKSFSRRSRPTYEPYIAPWGPSSSPASVSFGSSFASLSSVIGVFPRSLDIPLVVLARPSVDTLPVYTPPESSGLPAGFCSLEVPSPAYTR